MRNPLSILLLLVMIFGSIPQAALARGNDNNDDKRDNTPQFQEQRRTPERRETPEQFRQRQHDFRAGRVGRGQRCEYIQENLDNRISRYRENFIIRQERYTLLSEKVSTAITRLKELNIDVSGLETLLEQLNTMIRDFKATFGLLIQDLESANSLACGEESTDEFKQSLTSAKQHLAELREKGKAIHDFMQDQIKPAIQEIKSQLDQNNS